MNKNIATLVILDKTKPLFLIEPFHFTFCQNSTLLSKKIHHWPVYAKNKKTTSIQEIDLGSQVVNCYTAE